MSSIVKPPEQSKKLSVLGAQWDFDDVDFDDIAKLTKKYDVPEIIARILIARGVNEEEVTSFLKPTLKNNFPDPSVLQGMDALTLEFANWLEAGKKIMVFGDFDVDGATSSAILYRFLKYVGAEIGFYIPGRLTEGYGPNIDALESFKADGFDIVILADCGTAAFDVVDKGREAGLEIVIMDHHEAESNLPNANHIINPKRQDDTSDLDMLAACGVCFMFVVALNRELRARDFYESAAVKEPDMRAFLDLVALGTVCDMVPLKGVNRLLVKHGFAAMQTSDNPGLCALMDVSQINGEVSPYHAGFVLGPRINAGSRIHKSELGARLLITEDTEEAQNLAWILEDCNDKRKDIQKSMEEHAIRMVEESEAQNDAVIVVGHEDWHPGLSGLVAGRLKEKYGVPSVVITYTKNQHGVLEGRGSGRSVPGMHIAHAFIEARQEGLLVKGGGHAMAGGFTLEPEKSERLQIFLKEYFEKQRLAGGDDIITNVSGVLSTRALSPSLVDTLEGSLGPFGQENEEPIFCFENVRIHKADIVGDAHIRAMLSDWEGGAWVKAIAFRAREIALGDALLSAAKLSEPLDMLGRIKKNEWNGQVSAEIHIRDIRQVT